MYLFIILLTLFLVFITFLLLKKQKLEKFTSKKIAYFPKKKDIKTKSFASEYPDKYGITNDIPDVSKFLVAKNENILHDYHINYKDSPMNYKEKSEPLPKDYFIIDRDFHTPREGSEILPKPIVYNLARVDNTNYFLVETPDSIWRQVVPKD